METMKIEKSDLRKLLGAANGDAALLYLYINAGGEPQAAAGTLKMPQSRYDCAAATLRQLGLWPQEKPSPIAPGERPAYNEKDVLEAMNKDGDFKLLYGEVQRLLGKSLNTEELKILLGFIRYLGLPVEVICILVSYCRDRARLKGSLRNPSLRTIEKEAYFWAEQGIDTLEEAAAYISEQNQKNSDLRRLMDKLQIRGRTLTQAEERYARSWLNMGFADDVIAMAYEKTCVNTGALSWPYMNKILTSWHEAGYKTVQQIQSADRKPTAPKGASGELGQAELAAIARVLKEG